jgi:hypothetical protein
MKHDIRLVCLRCHWDKLVRIFGIKFIRDKCPVCDEETETLYLGYGRRRKDVV